MEGVYLILSWKEFNHFTLYHSRPLYSNGGNLNLFYHSSNKWMVDLAANLANADAPGMIQADSTALCPPVTGWEYHAVDGETFPFKPIVRATSFVVESKFDDAIHHTDDTTQAIAVSGNVHISAQPTFNDLTVKGTSINGKSIGCCLSPFILTTDTCGTSAEQEITGTHTFGVAAGKQDLTVTKINLPDDATVNGEDWQELVDAMVAKTSAEATTVTVTGKKTFQQADFNVDTALDVFFESNVFGLSPEGAAKVTDMTFASGNNNADNSKPNMPDLVDALVKIKDNSYNFPDQFLHMTPIYTVPNFNNRAKTIGALEGLTIADQAAWDALPFHAVTFLGTSDGNRVISVFFKKLTGNDGDVQLVDVDPVLGLEPFAMDTEDTHVFGDIVVWEHQSLQIYVLLFKESTASTSKLKYLTWAEGQLKDVEAAPLSYTFAMEEDGLTDLEPARKGDKSCFIGCGDKVQMLCGTDPLFTFPGALSCFKASAQVVDSDESLVLAAVNKDLSTGQIIVYSSTSEADYIEVQRIRCYMCTAVDTGKQGGDIFLVLTSKTYGFTYIGKYNPTSSKFEVFQSLKLEKPSEAKFFTHDGKLQLSIIVGIGTYSEIRRFAYRGAMGFMEVPKMTMKLGEITSHEIIAHPKLSSPLLSTTGTTMICLP